MSKNKNKRNVKINRNVLIDVVIPNRGKFDFLEKCLNKLPEAMGELSYNVWICDNGSKPEEVVFYDKYRTSSQIHITIYHTGLGYPKACNMAAKQGNAPLILILTNDVFLEPHSVEHMVRELDEPKNGVAGMKLLFPEGTPHGPPNKVQHVGIELNIKADFYHQFIGWSPDNPKVLAKKEAFAVTGAVFLTRRSIWNRLKGFNEIYGLGCLTGDTMLFTNDGIQTLGELYQVHQGTNKVDLDVASELDTRKSNLFYHNGESKTLKVTLEKQFSLQGTYDHKVRMMSTNGEIVWKSLEDLKIGDYVAIRYNQQLFGSKTLLSDDAYLAGLYIAEGSFEKMGRVTITTRDREISDFISTYGFRQSGGIYHWRLSDKEFIKKFEFIDWSQKALTKEIPKYILQSDKETQRHFLSGLFDGDGCAIKDGRVNFSSSSYKLIKQVQMMLLNFGIVVGIHSRISKSGRLNYLLDFGSDSGKFYELIGFRLSRKQERHKLVRDRLSPIIPFQRELFRQLYSSKDVGDRNWKTFGMYYNNPCQGVRRDTIEALVDTFDRHCGILSDNLLYECVWLPVVGIEDGGVQDTFDLHVPNTNAYVANGFIVHNTYEDVEYCVQTRKLGYNIVISQEAIGYHWVNATAADGGFAYPLNENKHIFMSRNSKDLIWQEYKWW